MIRIKNFDPANSRSQIARSLRGDPTCAGSRAIWLTALAVLPLMVFVGCNPKIDFASVAPEQDGTFHVVPGESIQAALESAAKSSAHKTVLVHAGTYRPDRPGQALIWLNRRHDGITLQAEGEVILTAANEQVAERSADSYPAIVNHVVYFGDGISEQTVLRGFKITGANHFVTKSERPMSIQPDIAHPELEKGLFFYADGGGIKIFGRSYPTIVDVEVYDNYSNPCGGGVSVEHRGFNDRAATFRNCIFRNNRSEITGSALDVLPGSFAVIENCLFVGNISNLGPDWVSPPRDQHNPQHGSGALTVFRTSRVKVDRCTFTRNWNGADDKGEHNSFTNCIFWMNDLSGGVSPGARYELDILDALQVSDCFFHGDRIDLRGTIDEDRNQFHAPDPRFDAAYRPMADEYTDAGYRPMSNSETETN